MDDFSVDGTNNSIVGNIGSAIIQGSGSNQVTNKFV